MEGPPAGKGSNRLTRRGFVAGLLGFTVGILRRPLAGQGAWAGSAGSLRDLLRVQWDESFEVAIQFQIGDPRSAATRRPYVAVFIEDAAGKPVRTVSLWAQRQISWLRHLRHWYRAEIERQTAEGGNLISTLTSATRRVGEYTVLWDGRNNKGEYVEQGEYYICIESVRQNAGNHLVRKAFTFATTPFVGSIEDYTDLRNIRIELRKK